MESPRVLTRAQSRLVDRIAIDEFGIPGVVLMENAGRGVVETLLAIDPVLVAPANILNKTARPPRGPSPEGLALRLGAGAAEGGAPAFAILCGKGNNADDGFVIARHLEIRGVATRVLLLCPPNELTGDALVNFEILARSGADLRDISSPHSADSSRLREMLDSHAGGAVWLIDAMLGTGAVSEPREPFAAAIAWMNSQPARRLAVDIASGLDCDSGQAASVTVRADVTCTFVAAKPGLLAETAAAYVGALHVISIGVPPSVIRRAAQA